MHQSLKYTLFLVIYIFSSPIAVSTEPEETAVQITAADVPSNWLGLNPDWKDNIVFYQDGTFVRPHIGGGHWNVINDEGKPSLMLRWNSWGTEKLIFISPDHLQGNHERGLFRLYRIPQAPAKVLPMIPNQAEMEATKNRLNDSKWELIDHKRFKLNSDGSISSEFDSRKGNWEVVAPNTLKISVPWQPSPPNMITTNRDATILRWTEDETNLAVRDGS